MSIALRLGLYYAALFIGTGASAPYAGMWFRAHGLSGAAIGLILALARRLKLLLGDTLLLRVEVRPLDLARQLLGVAVPDALSQSTLDVVVNNLREAAELFLDGLRLLDQHLEHPIFDPLREHEIVAVHFRSRLKLAVDAAIALLDPARIPGQVEMEEIRTMRLEVQAFASRIGREQDT